MRRSDHPLCHTGSPSHWRKTCPSPCSGTDAGCAHEGHRESWDYLRTLPTTLSSFVLHVCSYVVCREVFLCLSKMILPSTLNHSSLFSEKLCCAQSLGHIRVTPQGVAHQVPLSMGCSRQGYWSGLLFPIPGSEKPVS